jgi:hypothetical protein
MKVTDFEIKQRTYKIEQNNIMKEEPLFSLQLLQGKNGKMLEQQNKDAR